MPVNGSKPRGPRIDLNEPSQLRAWARYWGCTRQNILDAIHNSGVMVADVEDWLRINVIR